MFQRGQKGEQRARALRPPRGRGMLRARLCGRCALPRSPFAFFITLYCPLFGQYVLGRRY